MTNLSIKSATASDQDGAITVLLLAFSTDPIARWMYPNPQQYLTYFSQVARIMGGNAFQHGTGYYVEGFLGAEHCGSLLMCTHKDEMVALLQQTIPEHNQEVAFTALE